MQSTAIQPFHRGLDRDTDIRLLQKGSYLDAMNIKITNALSGRTGVVTNLFGIKNVSGTTYVGLTGDTLLNIFPDRINNCLYAFIANSTGSGNTMHRIVKYVPATGVWSIVIKSTVLAFSSTHRITSFDVVENFILWTDNYNPPRIWDTSLTYTSYTLDESYLSTAVLVPNRAPTVGVNTDTNFASNFIVGKFLQFKYRFVYANKQKSVFSPISEMVYSESDYLSPDAVSTGIQENNMITVSVPKNNANRLVEKIEVAARSGNSGDFSIIHTETLVSSFWSSGFTFNYYNNNVSVSLSPEESNQLYDDMPKTARAQRYAKNRMLYAGTKNGYDKPAVDLTVSTTTNSRPNVDLLIKESASMTCLTDATGAAMTTALSGYTLAAGDKILVRGQSDTTTNPYHQAFGATYITVGVGWTMANLVTAINAVLIYVAYLSENHTIPFTNHDYYYHVTDDPYDPLYGIDICWWNDYMRFEISRGGSEHDETFKSGARYQVAIQYFDGNGRTNGALTSASAGVYIPTIAERHLTAGSVIGAGSTYLKVDIANLPPSWAKYYNIVWANTYKDSFTLTTTVYDTVVGSLAGTIKLDIYPLILAMQNNKSLKSYTWQKGDRVRFITVDADGGAGGAGVQEWASSVYDAEIIAEYDYFSATDDGHQSIEIYLPNSMTVAMAKNTQIEIYRPSISYAADQVLYHESPRMYDIIGGYHDGDIPQNSYSPASVYLTHGDAFLIKRELVLTSLITPVKMFVESYSLSDFIESEHYSIGRPTAIIDQAESDNNATIYYTEAFIPNTNVNGLNRIYPDINYEEYNKSFGAILLMHNEGDSFTMFQEDKVSKVMLEQRIMYDAQGNANYIGSENVVLSVAVPYAGEYGIQTPFSFQFFGNRKYFVDLSRGVACRLSIDGIDEISRAGMRGWFYDTCKTTMGQSDLNVFGLYDPMNDEYLPSFSYAQKTLCYNESINDGNGGWSSFLSTHFKGSATIDNKVFYTDGLAVYEINQPVATVHRNAIKNAAGVESNLASYIQFVVNEEAQSDKNFLAIALDGNKAWDVTITTEEGQSSTLLAAVDFRQRETEWQAAFLRDSNTPNITNPLLEGDRIKGKEAKIKLDLTAGASTSEVYLKLARVVISRG